MLGRLPSREEGRASPDTNPRGALESVSTSGGASVPHPCRDPFSQFPVLAADVARQVDVPPEAFSAYDWGLRTIKYHRARPPVEQVGPPSGRLGATHRPDEGAHRRLAVWCSRAWCGAGVPGRPYRPRLASGDPEKASWAG